MAVKKASIQLFFICVMIGLFSIMVSVIGSSYVSTWVENSPIQDRTTVIIDAGHGGEDGGAISCTGYPESVINLEIAKRVNDLMRLLGVNTLMIRDSDISVYTSGTTLAQKKVSDLKKRVEIVNKTEDAILVSIHQNYFTDGRYSGPQVFYSNIEDAKGLARTIQDSLNRCLSGSRKAKASDGVYLMEHIHHPGVLIECGFLSNQQEEALLRTPEYQKKVSSILASVICTYLNDDFA